MHRRTRVLAGFWVAFLLLVCLGFQASPATAAVAYVANRDSNSVSVVDSATNSVVGSFGVDSPFGVAFTPDGSRAYVTSFFSNYVAAVDTATNTILATIPSGGSPSGVVVTPDGSKVYVANNAGRDLVVISTATNT